MQCTFEPNISNIVGQREASLSLIKYPIGEYFVRMENRLFQKKEEMDKLYSIKVRDGTRSISHLLNLMMKDSRSIPSLSS